MRVPVAPYRYARRVHYDEFCQRVRRHAPSSLLSIIAAVGAQYALPEAWIKSPHLKYTPWNLAEVARVSLTLGNEHRPAAVDSDLMMCCAAYSSMSDPDLTQLTLKAWGKFMLRLSSEQMAHQLPMVNELARSIALFEQTKVGRSLEVLDTVWAQELFGCSIAEYVSVALLFHVGALMNHGRFNLSWLDQENFAQITAEIGAEVIRRIALEHFVASPDEFKRLQPPNLATRHPDTWRFQFNPLQARPVISDLGPHLLIPVPSMLVQKVSPLGIFHTGVQRWGDKFARDVGHLFEAYVGRQLQLLDGATVHRSISYNKNRRELCDSVDWIAVFDDVILLVEVKSTRTTEAIRAGDDAAATDLNRRLAKAFKQINTTAEQIRGKNPAFDVIPADLPIFGLVVTLEPFHVVNAQPYRQWLPESPDPVLVCAAFELERMVMIKGRTAGNVLLDLVQDATKRDWGVGISVERAEGATFERNPIIDQAWDQLAWGGDRDQGTLDH